jgi:hypothetical protein
MNAKQVRSLHTLKVDNYLCLEDDGADAQPISFFEPRFLDQIKKSDFLKDFAQTNMIGSFSGSLNRQPQNLIYLGYMVFCPFVKAQSALSLNGLMLSNSIVLD